MRSRSPFSRRSLSADNRSALLLHVHHSEIRRSPHAGDGRNILSAGTPVALGMAAIHQGFEPDPLANEQSAHSLRPVELVRGNGEQMHTEFAHVDGKFPRRLHGICMEDDTCFRRDLANLCNGLDRPQFVVRKHDANQNRFRTNRSPDILRIHNPFAIHREHRHLKSALRIKALHESKTALCSIAEVITCLSGPGAAATTPKMA